MCTEGRACQSELLSRARPSELREELVNVNSYRSSSV